MSEMISDPTFPNRECRRLPLLALLLLIPAPSLGVAFGMYWFPDSAFGKGIFFLSKIWILIIPLAWHLMVYRQPRSWSAPRRGGLWTGAGLGLLISAFIVTVFACFGASMIDPETMRTSMKEIGLDAAPVYLAGALYWITVNSFLEEVVWRWFVVRESEKLMGAKAAIGFSALAFTLHHLVAMKLYFNWPTTLLCGLGIFIGGAVWSWCYIRYRSIWPGYVSHAIVDVAVFGIGYVLIF
ncbi:MAG: CPBP family intramembrane metalloprotease [Verrucomicrobia bacterium]|nr:CPBP family intramembrane metalloprotease [Verrucomicrobiota bacterium]